MFKTGLKKQKIPYEQLLVAYQPILRACFGVVSIYYTILLVTFIFDANNVDFETLSITSFMAALISGYAFNLLKKPISISLLELLTFFINIFMLMNVLISFNNKYDHSKLIYFAIMSMFFAFAKVTFRQALISITLAQFSLFFVVLQNEPDKIDEYIYISFAATLASVAMTYFLQRGMALTVIARQDADKARAKAEERLVTAEQLSEKMRLQALSDSLTGLPNRRSFFEEFAVHAAKRGSPDGACLVLLDLDGFKAVNDNYGHFIGDRLLEAVATRLREHCGADTHVSRMGGDEFNILLNNRKTEEEAEAWCVELLEKIAKVYLIEDRLIQISASVGCYRPEAGDEDTIIMQCADLALLHAKRSGKNRVVVFQNEHAHDAAQRFRIEQALRQANFCDEIELLYQPQFDLTRNQAVSAEALARWHSPSIGAVPPIHFIKVAEEIGLIAHITFAVLDKALAQLQAWPNPIPLSINLSGHDITSDPVIDQIIDRVRMSGVSPEYIEFEVTETAMMADTQRAAKNLERLSKLGHRIALDDFGTGYSNFSYLRTLPMSKLKVDRSFMENITDPMTEKVLLGLVAMARTLGVQCLLEGIETELELLVAKRVGAQSIQGYYFGKPMKPADLEAHFKAEIPHASVGMSHGKSVPAIRNLRWIAAI